MKYQIPCDKCDLAEDEDKLIETFDNELLCSSCYIKKEFHTKNEEGKNGRKPKNRNCRRNC